MPAVFAGLQTRFEEFLKQNSTNLKSECYIPLSVGELIASGQLRMKVLRTNDSWFGVTYREDRPHVVESIGKLIAAGDYPKKLWS